MVEASFILSSIVKCYLKIKSSAQNSFFASVLARIGIFFGRILSGSTIIMYFVGNKSIDKNVQESGIFRGFAKIGLKLRQFYQKHIKAFMEGSIIVQLILRYDLLFVATILLIALFPILSTSISVIGCALIVVAILIYYVFGEISFRKDSAFILFGVLFLGSILVGSLKNNYQTDGKTISIIYFSYISVCLLLPLIVKQKKQLYLLLNAILFMTLLLSLYGIYQRITGVAMDSAWIDEEVFTKQMTRIYAVFGNPNVYGEYLILVTPLAFALFNTSKNFIMKIIYLGIFALAGLNLLLTMSRGSMIGLAFAMLLIFIICDRKYLILAAVGLMLSPYFVPDSIINRIMSITSGGDSSTDYRLSIYNASFRMLKDHFTTGIGLGNFKNVYKIYAYTAAKSFHAHNTILMVCIELGVYGIVSLSVLMFVWFKKVMETLFSKGSDLQYIAVSAFAGVAGCTVQGLVDHVWHNFDLLFMYFVVISIGWISATLNNRLQKKQEGDIHES